MQPRYTDDRRTAQRGGCMVASLYSAVIALVVAAGYLFGHAMGWLS